MEVIKMKNDKDMLDKYKERIKRQNNKIKEDYDRVSATLPKGTIERIKALGLTINGVINDSVLSFLECAEVAAQERLTQPTSDSLEDKPNPAHEIEDMEKLQEYLEQLRKDNEQRKQVEKAVDKAKIENALEE